MFLARTDALCPSQKHKEQEEERKKVRLMEQGYTGKSWESASPPVHDLAAAAMQKEEAEAAKIYAEFVESFGEEPSQDRAGPKPFVRSHTILPGSSPSLAGMHPHSATLSSCRSARPIPQRAWLS